MNFREINYLVLDGTYYAQNYAGILHHCLVAVVAANMTAAESQHLHLLYH